MAKSLGIWSNHDIKVNLHFNLWKLPLKENIKLDKYFLDIGIYVEKELNTLEKDPVIKLFLPFKMEDDQFYCLSNNLIQDDKLLDSIFNKPLSYSKKGSTETHFLINDNQNKDNSFMINNLDSIEIDRKENFSTIELSLDKKSLLESTQYFRFRVFLEEEKFTKTVKDKDFFLKSYYVQEELIEFRINEIRNLHQELQNFFSKEPNKIKIQQIHYFLVRGNDANLILSHENFKRCRSVEYDIWQSYIQDTQCALTHSKSILSYHWVTKVSPEGDESIEHYGTFAKFRYSKDDKIVMYIIALMILSLVFGVLGEALYDLNGKFGEVISLLLIIGIPSLIILKLCYNILKWTKELFCCLCNKIICDDKK